jgi:hypothetical protein
LERSDDGKGIIYTIGEKISFWDKNIKILSHVHELINMTTTESKLVQSIRDILEKKGLKGLAGYEVKENPENRTAEVVLLSGEKILIRGRDSIDVREKKLKEFVSPMIHNLIKEAANASYGNSINPIPSQENNMAEISKISKAVAEVLNPPYTNTIVTAKPDSGDKIHIKEGDIEFDLLVSEKNGKKYYTCPCNQTYDQKGHAKWNHIKRHLNRKSKRSE